MVDFVFPSKRTGWVTGVRGTVVSSRKWTETHVSSSGGGGYVGKYGGQIHAPQVHSTIVEKGEIWIKNRNGLDVCVNVRVPAIEGQEVVVLWGGKTNSKTGEFLYWKNFSSNKSGIFTPISKFFWQTSSEASTIRYIEWGTILLVAVITMFFISSVSSNPYESHDDVEGTAVIGFIVGVILGLIVNIFVMMIINLAWQGRIKMRCQMMQTSFDQFVMKDDVLLNG